MNNEIKPKGAFYRALGLGIGLALVLLMTGGLQAAPLWTNGAVNTIPSGDNRCDSGGPCATTGPWTVFDNFNIAPTSKAWVVSSFDFTDFLLNGATTDYKNTTWSIWNGNPLGTGMNAGKLVASGTTTASLGALGSCGSNCQIVSFTVNLASSVTLASGNTYFLGTSNSLNPNATTQRAFAAGGNTAAGGTANAIQQWEQSNGSTSGVVGSTWSTGSLNFTFPGQLGVTEGATAFDINGTLLTPEPGTLTLFSVLFAGVCFVLRRRVA